MKERGEGGEASSPASQGPSPSGPHAVSLSDDPTVREIDAWMFELVARLAHDLRTPLGAIRMWSHVLRSGREADRPAALDAIDASTAGLSEQMAFLADVTRAVVGRLPVEKQACDVRSLMKQGVEVAARDLARRGVHVDLQITVPDAEPLVLDGDEVRLRRALTCLVAAAGAFTTADGTVVARLAVGGLAGARAAVFTIRVPQARVDESETRHLFTPYHPGKADLGHPRPDFGLGPVFARSVARLYGGDVHATAEGDDGGTLLFTLRLPLRLGGTTTSSGSSGA